MEPAREPTFEEEFDRLFTRAFAYPDETAPATIHIAIEPPAPRVGDDVIVTVTFTDPDSAIFERRQASTSVTAIPTYNSVGTNSCDATSGSATARYEHEYAASGDYVITVDLWDPFSCPVFSFSTE